MSEISNNGTSNSRSLRHGLTNGQLPPGAKYIQNRIDKFRRNLEGLVEALKGSVSVIDAAAINSACKWERHGLLAQRWLRKEAEKLTATERLKFSEAIAKASDQRDKNLRLLGLDRGPEDPWEEAFDGTIEETNGDNHEDQT